MDTPSKVAHTKYAVAETHIPGVKLITVIHVLKLFVYNHCEPCTFVLSSRSRAHANQMSEVDVTEPLHPT